MLAVSDDDFTPEQRANIDISRGPVFFNVENFDRMLTRIKQLERALAEAIELAEEGWGYASPYFREKWACEQRIAELRALLPVPQSCEAAGGPSDEK